LGCLPYSSLFTVLGHHSLLLLAYSFPCLAHIPGLGEAESSGG
jgi:hypothetical protein